MGIILKFKKNTNKAIEYFNKSIIADPANPVPHNNLGNIFSENNHKCDALSHYEKAIKIDPIYDVPYVGIGNLKFNSGDTKGAINSYNKALKINENNSDAMIGIGNCYKSNSNNHEAVTFYKKAIENGGCNKDLCMELFEFYYENKNFHQAVEILQNAIKIDPLDANLFKQLGELREITDERDQAVSAYVQFLELKCNEGDLLTKKIILDFDSLSDLNKSIYDNEQIIKLFSQSIKKFLTYEEKPPFFNIGFMDQMNKPCLLSPLNDTKIKAYEIFSKKFVERVLMEERNFYPQPRLKDEAMLTSVR